MNLEWSPESFEDLSRLHDFLAPVNPRAAANAVQMLVRAGLQLPDMPRAGQRVEDFGMREVRRVIVDGRPWEPLRPLSITRSGNALINVQTAARMLSQL